MVSGGLREYIQNKVILKPTTQRLDTKDHALTLSLSENSGSSVGVVVLSYKWFIQGLFFYQLQGVRSKHMSRYTSTLRYRLVHIKIT